MAKKRHEIGAEILELIGLPSRLCKGFAINCPVDRMWTVSAEYLIPSEKKGAFKEIVAKYNLVIKKNAERLD